MDKFLRLSVHQLVDFLLRTGDIDNRVFNRTTMSEGSRLHSFYQSKQDSNYLSEYPLKTLIVRNNVEIVFEGRADGIIRKSDGSYTIDEIKTTVEELKDFFEENKTWHIGQAKCYAYMFAKEQNLDEMQIRLTYIRQGKEKEKFVQYYDYTYLELEQFVFDLLDEYLDFYNIIIRRSEERNASINTLEFPFDKFRPGQRKIAKYCYSLTQKGGKLFCEAPTGIGKTMSTLFPYIKSLEKDEESKIFYLTAKSSGKESAYNAIKTLKEHGLSITEIVVTAKEKICFCKGKSCNPDECPYARKYYSKIQNVLTYSIVNYNSFNEELIEQIAYENQICPFEFQLDLSLFSDVIICDYNYLFHPISYMKRYFDLDNPHYLALIDEAHNLVDRSRDMYSSCLCYLGFMQAKKSVRHVKIARLKTSLAKVNKLFKEYFEKYDLGETVVENFSDETYKIFTSFINTMQDLMKDYSKDITKELLDFYLDVNQFMKIRELVNDKYLIYVGKTEDDIILNLYCMDASSFLSKVLQQIKASTFFSATLTPLKYYMDTLGADYENDPSMVLPSPFPKENLKIFIAPKISIKYKNRDSSYDEVAKYINSFVKGKVGNYFVYVPSYEYLDKLTHLFEESEYDIFIQEKEMSEKEKVAFLDNFHTSPEKTTIGFLVLGGAFGEGIDLVSDRLIGAIIVGIGLPKLNFKSNMISEYFKNNALPGYEYAYINPGMNKVMQAIGRVIRSENDRGAILLIDDRYLNSNYRNLFKEEWKTYDVVFSPQEIEKEITKFFKD